MKLSVLLILGGVCAAMAPRTTAAQSAIDPVATVVELRVSCAMPGNTFLDNCFETSADVTDWLWNGGRASEPNSLDRVTVRVGPGEFSRFECNSSTGMRGFVSVVGSGRDVTHFVSTSTYADPALEYTCAGGVTALGCTGLSFSNLAARGFGTGGTWRGDGTSNWESVDLIGDDQGTRRCAGNTMGWYDAGPEVDESLHFFWDTRFVAESVGNFSIAAYNGRGESWIYASDFVVQARGSGGGGFYAGVFGGAPRGIHLFGSTVRVHAESPFAGLVTGLFGKSIAPSAIHMHGAIVNVDAPLSVGILTAQTGAFVHTPGTAFVFPGTGVKYRILRQGGSSTIQSPFLWPSGTIPPNIYSLDGSDLFVKTNEGPNQDESHLFVYDSSCATNRWRSVTTGNCL